MQQSLMGATKPNGNIIMNLIRALLISSLFITIYEANAFSIHTWDPNIALGCYVVPVSDSDWNNLINKPVISPCDATNPNFCANCTGVTPGKPRFAFSNTNENYCFQGHTGEIPEGSPVLPKWFTRTGNNTWAVGLGVDKYNVGSEYYDKWVAHVFNDIALSTNPPPYILSDVRATFYMMKVQSLIGSYINQTTSCNPVPVGPFTPGCASQSTLGGTHPIGDAVSRVVLGAVANWNGRVHYLEIVLWRTPTADLVTQSNNRDYCPAGWPWLDTVDNIFDRRAWYSGGDVVYLYGPNLDKLPGMTASDKTPALTGAVTLYDINLGRAFRSTPWSDYPSNWAGITIAGVYIGVEIWGKALTTVAFSDYRVYTP